jgi:2-polyprenyl-3-methyl-5-hydroxy-6-metoxy-1,4-benzoquinol methylase
MERNNVIMNCKMCNSKNLEMVLDLGFVALVDRFLSAEELNKPETQYPLNLRICKDCGLVQLGHIVPAKELFDENYAYESSTTITRRDNHSQLAKYVCEQFSIPDNSLIVDIGSNVGVLLEEFKKNGMTVCGVDASKNIVSIANSKGIDTILGFFDSNIVKKIISTRKRASVVTATNLFAHIQDYGSFIHALKNILTVDGIFVFQVPHLLQLIKHLEYDTIYHEHVSYFGLKPLMKFFECSEMEIFDVIETEIDGGSIRCFVAKKGQKEISSNIQKLIEKEEIEQIYSVSRLTKFSEDVKKQKESLLKLLYDLKKENKRIVGVSAPAKGMTLLNYCKIDTYLLEYITEKSPLKIGKYTPGMHIPVKPDKFLLQDMPDYALILAWNFSTEIMKNLQEYSNAGGKFIIPIPTPKIV